MHTLYLITPTRPGGTIAAFGPAVPLSAPSSWAGEPVTGAWVETDQGEIAMRWGRVPSAIASRPCLMDDLKAAMGGVH
jgi:hypothetical protein